MGRTRAPSQLSTDQGVAVPCRRAKGERKRDPRGGCCTVNNTMVLGLPTLSVTPPHRSNVTLITPHSNLFPLQFIGQRAGFVNLPQGLGHPRRVHGHGTVALLVVNVVAYQALDVPVKDQTHNLAVAVDHW